MASSAYKYVGDDGQTYQIVLPIDFAAQLAYQAATGFEPYLPSWIRPRWCTYQASAGVFLQSVIITSPLKVFIPPATITIGGVVYTLKSTYGEQRGFTAPADVIVVAGEQGPPGGIPVAGTGISVTPSGGNYIISATGSLSISSAVPAANVTMTNASTNYVATSLSLSAGSYLLLATVVLTTASGDNPAAFLFNSTDSTNIASVSGNNSVATAYITMSFNALVALAATKTIQLICKSDQAGDVIQKNSRLNIGPATQLIAVKYA